jgi:hypothetical protein
MLLVLTSTAIAQSAEWEPVIGEENLRNFMSGKTLEWEEPGGARSRGEYRPDGTGTLYSWGGAQMSRPWEVKGDDQICVTARQVTQCWRLEKNTTDPTLYRSIEVATGTVTEIRMSKDGATATVEGGPKATGNKGGPAAASADEIAAQLSNPASAVASLTFRNQFRWFEGDLPGADDQSSYTIFFQPILPFPLANKDKIIWRPGVSLVVDKPIFDPGKPGFDGKTGLTDIISEQIYTHTTENGIILGGGFITTLPTGTSSELTSGQWSLGPDVVLGKLSKKYVLVGIANHQWDVTGWTDNNVNLTTLSAILTFLPGGGWNWGSAPVMTYDWENEQWTIPLQINVGKTVVLNGRPWKFGLDLNYYVEKADAFGPKWMLAINVTPVVKNGLASWFGLGGN